jgi:hypothetical protein
MYPIYDPDLALQLHHQKVAGLYREADAHRLAREARKTRRPRFGRRRSAAAQPRPVMP